MESEKMELLLIVERCITILETDIELSQHSKIELHKDFITLREKMKAASSNNKAAKLFREFLEFVFKIIT